ncbi:pr140 [rat cytomegalovirus strain Maastricht]|uniref:Pr140 n=2 Tax=Murid betaherpesvirus 2 TaxID=28304 RepID=Q9DW55_RCMVM|nr:pr140 [rat cytomegalovirus strain Maastricht]AAF99235.1 pr140 [rat cytomegalovirus strain Maastricht]WEG72054.1 protein m140 [Murid betaherpesvirus 2]CAI64575.1 r140 protein [Murid betaherpesvirus 2]
MDTTWESLPVTGDPSPYRHTSRSVFLRVMMGFRYFYRTQGNPATIAETASRQKGDRLLLGIPHNWFLDVGPAEQWPELRDRDLTGLVCCDETLTPVGELVVREQGLYEKTAAFLCLGTLGRVYAYDSKADAAILVSSSLDKLARFGLLHCELVYRYPRTPQTTLTPPRLVSDLLSCDTLNEVRTYCERYRDLDVALYTPGYRFQAMKVTSEFEEIAAHWPFNAMDEDCLRRCRDTVANRLCCPWRTLGIVGEYTASSYFFARHVLVVDAFLAVYTVDATRQKFYRVADDLNELFRAGLCKSVSFGARFDRGDRGDRRCESVTICPHVSDSIRPVMTEADLENEHLWLCRDDRFCADMRTWDDADKRALRHATLHRRQRRVNGQIESRDDADDEDSSDDDDEDDDDEDVYPSADDGTRRYAWPQESPWRVEGTIEEPSEPSLSSSMGYMTMNGGGNVELVEVEQRRVRERETNNHDPGLSVTIPGW